MANTIRNRVASIVSSMIGPEWVINIRRNRHDPPELTTPDIANLKEITINSAKFRTTAVGCPEALLLVAANASNKVAVVDTGKAKLAALVDTAKIPHLGRGANFNHPEVPARSGRPRTSVRQDQHHRCSIRRTTSSTPGRWFQEVPNHGANSLFVKSHPKSKNLGRRSAEPGSEAGRFGLAQHRRLRKCWIRRLR